MRLDDERDSDNIEDMRGQSSGIGGGLGGGLGGLLGGLGGGRMGIGGLIVVGVLALILGINPLTLLGGGSGGSAPSQQIGQPQEPAAAPAERSDMDRFVSRVLATTEDSWAAQFKSEVGQPYVAPKLVLFTGGVQSGCGAAQSAMGPFYCPADSKVYLDQSFFDELARRFGAPGDFAAAYVIAHEVGHHVQNLLGISEQAQRAQSRASRTEANAISVRVELQADCLAGVWAKANADLLEPGDVDEAMRAATAIGDDTLQRAAQGTVVPESFTHGSAAQRTRWFRRGMEGGTIASCDTFRADRL
jgi:predicted metalloprotease